MMFDSKHISHCIHPFLIQIYSSILIVSSNLRQVTICFASSFMIADVDPLVHSRIEKKRR